MSNLMNTGFWRRARRQPRNRDAPYARIVLTAFQAGEIVKDILRPTTLIGSLPGCNIQLISEKIAAAHCLLTLDAGVLRIRDLRSHGGIVVNGVRVDWTELHDGDRLQLGPFQCRIETNLSVPPNAGSAHDFAELQASGDNGRTRPGGSSPDNSPPPTGIGRAEGPIATAGGAIARLTIVAPDGRVTEKDVWRHTTLIGRLPGCNIQIASEQIAPVHCALTLDDGLLRVHDLRTRTGTRINGQPVDVGVLSNGDTLEVGPFTFRLNADFSPTRNSARPCGDGTVENGPPSPSADLLRAEVEQLRSRLRELEAERDRSARDQQADLEAQQRLDAERQSLRNERQQQNESIEQERTELRRRTDLLEESRALLETEKRKLDEHQRALLRSTDQLDHSRRDLEERQKQYQAERDSFDRDRIELESKMSTLAERENRLEQVVAALQEAQSRYVDEKEEIKQYASYLAHTQAALNGREASLRGEQEQLAADRARLAVERKAGEDIRRRLEDQRAAVMADQSRLKEQHELLAQETANLENGRRSLEQQSARQREESLRLAELRRQGEADLQKVETLRTRLQQQADLVQQEQTDLAAERQRLSQSEAELRRVRKRLDRQQLALAAEKQELRARESQFQSVADDLCRREREFDEATAALAEERSLLEQRQASFLLEKAGMERHAQALRKEQADVDDSRNELDAERRQVRLLEDRLREHERRLQERDSAIQSQSAQLADDRELVVRQADELTRERKRVREQQVQLHKDREELQALQEKLLSESNLRSEQLERQSRELENSQRELAEERHALESEWRELRDELERLRRETASIEKDRQDVERQRGEADRRSAELDRLQSERDPAGIELGPTLEALSAVSPGSRPLEGEFSISDQQAGDPSGTSGSERIESPATVPASLASSLFDRLRSLQQQHAACCSERDKLQFSQRKLRNALEQFARRQRKFHERACAFESDWHQCRNRQARAATVASQETLPPLEANGGNKPSAEEDEQLQSERARLKDKLRRLRQERRRFHCEVADFQRRQQHMPERATGNDESAIPLARDLNALAKLQQRFHTTNKQLQTERRRLLGELNRFRSKKRQIEVKRASAETAPARTESKRECAAETLSASPNERRELKGRRAKLLADRSALAAEWNELQALLERLMIRQRLAVDEQLPSFEAEYDRLKTLSADAAQLLTHLNDALAAVYARHEQLPASLGAVAAGCDELRAELQSLKSERKRFRKAMRSLKAARKRLDERTIAVADGETDSAIARSLVVHGVINSCQADWFVKGRFDDFALGGYQVVGHLDTRAFGWIYKTRDGRTGRDVAIKSLSERYASDPEIAARFEIEARIGSRLAHPQIVKTLDYDSSGEVPCLAMEFEEGINLRELVELHGPLEVDQACDLAVQAAMGLQHMHEADMVHRDVKPSNLLITADGRLKLLDFGLTLVADDEDEFSLAMIFGHDCLGTADYVAPEQVRDSYAVDSRADLYSLGCTLFFALTGSVPFSGQSVVEILASHRNGRVRTIRELARHVPERLERVISRLMAGDPADRIQTAADVARVLGRWGSRGPVYFDYQTVLSVRAAHTRRRLRRQAAAIRKGQDAAEWTEADSITRPLTQSTLDNR